MSDSVEIATDGGPVTLSAKGGMLYLAIPGHPFPSVLEIDPDELTSAIQALTKKESTR